MYGGTEVSRMQFCLRCVPVCVSAAVCGVDCVHLVLDELPRAAVRPRSCDARVRWGLTEAELIMDYLNNERFGANLIAHFHSFPFAPKYPSFGRSAGSKLRRLLCLSS